METNSLRSGGKKRKNEMKQQKEKKNRQAKWAERWTGEVERVVVPGDMPLMPPFHDNRFWYHDLIGQMS